MGALFDLNGKVAIVTGSSKGIGEAIARRMAQQGARVVISSRRQADCDAVVKSINDEYGNGREVAVAITCDIAKKDQLQNLVHKTVAKWGQLDIVVGNAVSTAERLVPSAQTTDAEFDETMHCDLRANHWLCHMAAPHLIKAGGGSIILISSVASLKGSKMLGTYGIAKAGLNALARNLAREYGEQNIRVNCISPGLIKTESAKPLWSNPENLNRIVGGYAIKRIGEPDEIAGAAVFLASPGGAFTTGVNIVIDGGSTC